MICFIFAVFCVHLFIINTIFQLLSSYYFSRQLSMSQYRAHSRVVVLHTLHRGQRDTRLCPYLATFYPFPFPHIWESSVLIPLLYSSIPSSSSSAAAAFSFAPNRPSPAFYHHIIPNRAPCFLSAVLHRSRIFRVAIYCETAF